MSLPLTTTSAEVRGDPGEAGQRVLTPDALAFVAELQREFDPMRTELLAARAVYRERLAAGEQPDFLAETRGIREDPDWRVAPAPRDLLDRRVEITGPVDRKSVIDALNSGAQMFTADFEDANSPTWRNCVEGQANLIDAVDRTISLDTNEKQHRLQDDVATLLVRPRGWHLDEKHLSVDGKPVSASLFDCGLYLFHCAERLLDAGSAPYFYLPKLESHLEARLWNDVFRFAQERLSIPRGTVRATVLLETIPAAFAMDEILYELREHAAGLAFGGWDYTFSIIKTFRDRPELVLADRPLVSTGAPSMRACAELLVKTCHRRGTHAIGAMAAFVPGRRGADANEVALAKVRADKSREAGDGFDGTWVAHPDLVSTAMCVFDDALGELPNQTGRLREDVSVTAADLLAVAGPPGEITEEGLRRNVSVGIRYLASWLDGVGAVAIDDLRADAATAEICRSQIWHWTRHGRVSRERVREIEQEELDRLGSRYRAAAALFDEVALADELVEFLTLPAYERLTAKEA